MWTLNDLITALNKEFQGLSSACYNSVKIDSREVKEGDIFIGIKGPNNDGSTFAKQAIENGAAFCIVNAIPHNCYQFKDKFVIVNDTYQDGLVQLAKYNRNIKYKNSTFIGVTGSVGKTTTKEMLKIVFDKLIGNTYATDGNKNNEYGLPLSIANIDDENLRCGIFELGMSAPGEISYLSKILKPNIGIITSIAPAHLEYFSGLDEIAAAKAEIVEGMPDNSSLIVNFDSPHIDTILKIADDKSNLKIFGYSQSKNNITADFKITLIGYEILKIDSNSYHTLVSLKYESNEGINGKVKYKIGCIGNEFIVNSMAVFSSLLVYSLAHDLDLEKIVIAMNALKSFHGLKTRGGTIHYQKFDIKVLDDSYNANPTSVAAALNRLSQNFQLSEYKRKIAILGDMLELGEDELKMHRELVKNITDNKIDKVFCIGKRMYELFQILPDHQKGLWFETSDEMSQNIINHIQPFDFIMIKGSFSMQMSKICSAIQKHCQ